MELSCSSTLRIPLGTCDLFGIDIQIRKHIIDICINEFKKYGGVELDTPVIETKTSITQLYGEEFNKLVYTLSDSNDKSTSTIDNIFMRYDLTLPFARYITMNNLKHFRRYQVGKVYRKDDPQISKGRYREFYQCDFDIIDVNNESRINEYETLDLFDNILNKLLNDNYLIKFNDRRFIKELLNKCDILDDDIILVSTVLDKLGKKSLEELKQELLDKKINESSINKIFEIYNDILKISTNQISYFEQLNIDSIKYIKQILDLNISNKIIFDPFVIRGMDYYTGIVFEAEYTNKDIMPSSIGGGGVYNKLMPLNINAVGLSIGIERIATIYDKMNLLQDIKQKYQIYVATIGPNMINERIKLVSMLRRNEFVTTMSHLETPSMRRQFDTVFEMNIPIMLIIGDYEIQNNKIKIKYVDKKQEELIDRCNLINVLSNYFN